MNAMYALFLLAVSMACMLFACNNNTKPNDTDLTEAARERLRSVVSQQLIRADSAGNRNHLDSALHWYAQATSGYTRMEEWDSMYNTVVDAFYACYYAQRFEPLDKMVDSFYVKVPVSQDTIQAKLSEIKGYIAFNNGQATTALNHYRKAANTWKQYPEGSRLAGCYNMLGILYNMLEDYQLARQIYQEGVRLSKVLGDTTLESRHYFNLGIVQLCLHEWQEALKSFNRSQQLSPYTDGSYEHNLSMAYLEGNEYEKALEYANTALSKRLDFEGDALLSLYELYNTFGNIHLSGGQSEQSEYYFQLSLEEALSSYGEGHREIAKAYIEIGEVYQARGLWNLAIRAYQNAITIFLPTFSPSSILEAPKPEVMQSREGYLMEALRNKAICLKEQFRGNKQPEKLQAAAQHLTSALQYINQLKLYHTESTSKVILGDRYSLPYVEDALEIDFMLYDLSGEQKYLEQAFETAQQSTAFLLREAVNEKTARQLARAAPDSLRMLDEVDAQISKVQNALPQSATPSERDSLYKIVFDLKQERISLLESFSRQYPDYYQLRHQLAPTPLHELQKALEKNTLAIKYFMGKERLYIFAFTNDNFHCSVSTVDSTLHGAMQGYKKSLSDIDYIRTNYQRAEEDFLRSSRYLYEVLLAPVLSEFTREASIEQLILIPDGKLNYLSFECLLSKEAESWQQPEAFLVNDYAIRYAYYSGLIQQTGSERKNKGKYLGFGTEYNDNTLEKVGLSAADTLANPFLEEALRDKNLSRLAYADDEVKEIANLLNGKAYLNHRATKYNFLNNAPNYEVLHIATHSFIDAENDSIAYIVFNQGGNSSDFLLGLHEIYPLSLQADLVALSGCQTGIGALQRSEGVMSLARAFQFAGCNSLVASQWSISDHASSVIMKQFYQHLQAGLPKAEALQQAKLDYLSDDELSSPAYRIPAYWGAFILVGNDAPIVFEAAGRANLKWALLAVAVFLLFLFGFFYRKRL